MATVRYFGLLRERTGMREETLPAPSVATMLREIERRHGKEAAHMAKKGHIIVNGENAGSHKGFRMKLSSGDVVQLLPVCGGG
ncbi:MAG: MoaD/ThiS family protein [Oscillospiraceae bacterium]